MPTSAISPASSTIPSTPFWARPGNQRRLVLARLLQLASNSPARRHGESHSRGVRSVPLGLPFRFRTRCVVVLHILSIQQLTAVFIVPKSLEIKAHGLGGIHPAVQLELVPRFVQVDSASNTCTLAALSRRPLTDWIPKTEPRTIYTYLQDFFTSQSGRTGPFDASMQCGCTQLIRRPWILRAAVIFSVACFSYARRTPVAARRHAVHSQASKPTNGHLSG